MLALSNVRWNDVNRDRELLKVCSILLNIWKEGFFSMHLALRRLGEC